MCLATVYNEGDNTVICRNVSRIDEEGDTLLITDIMVDEMKIIGRILSIDLANSVVRLVCD